MMTQLPIDYTRRPWKTKYIDEETLATNKWFIFGVFKDGTVDVSDGTEDILTHVPRAAAEEIIKARNDFVDVLLKHFGYNQETTND